MVSGSTLRKKILCGAAAGCYLSGEGTMQPPARGEVLKVVVLERPSKPHDLRIASGSGTR